MMFTSINADFCDDDDDDDELMVIIMVMMTKDKTGVQVPAPPLGAAVRPDGRHPQATKCQRVVNFHSIIHSVF